MAVLRGPAVAGRGHDERPPNRSASTACRTASSSSTRSTALLIVRPLEGLAWLCCRVRSLLDRRPGRTSSARCRDGSAARLRPLQGGLVQFYALAMVLGRAGAGRHVVDVASWMTCNLGNATCYSITLFLPLGGDRRAGRARRRQRPAAGALAGVAGRRWCCADRAGGQVPRRRTSRYRRDSSCHWLGALGTSASTSSFSRRRSTA